jgi:hypothetical protein
MGNLSARLRPSRLLNRSRLVKGTRKDPRISPVNSAISESLQNKDDSLLGRLKDVYVNSATESIQKPPSPVNLEVGVMKSKTEQKLPNSTSSPLIDDEIDGSSIPPGRLSVCQAVELLMLHQRDQEHISAEIIAKKFSLDVENARNLVKYFAVFKTAQVQELRKPDMRIKLTD